MQSLRRPVLAALSGPRLLRTVFPSIPNPPAPAPSPTEAVPDVTTFLTKIGRDTAQHAAKFTDWDALFATTSPQLKRMGIEPVRTRRYILTWREKFRAMDGKLELKEYKRGRKIDGGERRRKEVRAKRYQEERRVAAGTAR